MYGIMRKNANNFYSRTCNHALGKVVRSNNFELTPLSLKKYTPR